MSRQLTVQETQALEWIAVVCPAKLNLFLEVGAKRSDGYHELETVMAPLTLADRLWFRRRSDSELLLEVVCVGGQSGEGMPPAAENLIYQIVDGLRRATGTDQGIEFRLEKRIPIQAGMGGASSDAAAALRAANLSWGLGWSDARLAEFASRYGSDIPYFLAGGWAVCRGRGERVERLSRGLACPVVIVRPPVGFSTAEIYRRHQAPEQLHSIQPIVSAILSGRTGGVARELFNRLERAACGVSPWVERLQRLFGTLPALGHQMTGSGSCYFGIFPNKLVAHRVGNKLKSVLPDCRVIVSDLLAGD